MPDTPDLPPEAHNSEQDDEAAQAQTVAASAAALRHGDPTDSVKPDATEIPDLVDHMRDMEASGRIDMGAFSGEPAMDDEDDTYGDSAEDDN